MKFKNPFSQRNSSLAVVAPQQPAMKLFGLPTHYAATSSNPGVSGGSGVANSYSRFAKTTAIIGQLDVPSLTTYANLRKR